MVNSFVLPRSIVTNISATFLPAVRMHICGLLVFSVWVGSTFADSIHLFADRSDPRIDFAVLEIESALRERGHDYTLNGLSQFFQSDNPDRLVLAVRSNTDILDRLPEIRAISVSTAKEGFSIRVARSGDRRTVWVIGADSAGAMYGGLETSEALRLYDWDGIEDADQSPYFSMRGTKFNIPLDVRTPSYSDVSDSAQHNMIEMWNFDFWTSYLDQLARYRYNFVSLWNLHPFPSLVKVPDYPDVALNDVKQSKVEWKEHYDLEGTGFDSPEILEKTETIKTISIDEKIEFWRKVMRYGKDRNIDFYIVTWNIFDYGTEGKYGITDDIDNPVTRDYFRKSVKALFLTYPDLAGIGLTTGENMKNAGFQQKEEWAFQTYGQGVLDALAEQPGRQVRFIHRQHMAGAKDIARVFDSLIQHERIDFMFSFKYAQAHVLSSIYQPFHKHFIQEIAPLKTIWTLRNDDNYFFRWGAPDFVRQFIRQIPYEVSNGFYYGSDQYIWGREFLSLEPESPRELEIVKHGYQWMLWGRLGYNPSLENDRFVDLIQQRFPSVSGPDLFEAWQRVSMVYPTVTGFHWGALDFQWYIEFCQSRPGPAQTDSGFHDVNRFITLPPHPGTDNISIPDYVERKLEGKTIDGVTPIEVSDSLHAHADRGLELLESIDHHGRKELRLILDDIRAMAYMGKYYAHKIRGAVELALFRKNQDVSNQRRAIDELKQAAKFWRLYASTALANYKNPLWTNRVGYCDWRETTNHVMNDIVIAGGTLDE